MANTSRLLIDESPMTFQPSLAALLGSVDEAIILQQIQYWLKTSKNIHDGYTWVYNTYGDWNKQFPWIKSVTTLKRHFKNLEDTGVLVVGRYNKANFDKTKWYRIDYEKLDELNGQSSTRNCTTVDQKLDDDSPNSDDDKPETVLSNDQNLDVPTTNNWPTNTNRLPKTTQETNSNNNHASNESNSVDTYLPAIYEFWEKNNNGYLNDHTRVRLKNMMQELQTTTNMATESFGILHFAIQIALDSNKLSLNYLKTVLNQWLVSGIASLADARTANDRYQKQCADQGTKHPNTKIAPYVPLTRKQLNALPKIPIFKIGSELA